MQLRVAVLTYDESANLHYRCRQLHRGECWRIVPTNGITRHWLRRRLQVRCSEPRPAANYLATPPHVAILVGLKPKRGHRQNEFYSKSTLYLTGYFVKCR